MMYFIFTEKKCLLFCLAALLAGTFLGSVFVISSYAGNVRTTSSLKIIVDAGHGLPDGGAVGIGGTIEQEINLSIAKKLEEVLSAKGIDVIMTRSDDYGIWDDDTSSIREKKLNDMHNRLEIMRKSNASLFISIHMNSHSSPKASGLRIFYSPKYEEIKPLAENIQARMCDVTGASMNIVRAADSKLFLMKNPPVPAILVECGFLSNPQEEKKLSEDDYRARLAWAIADAVEKYYVLK